MVHLKNHFLDVQKVIIIKVDVFQNPELLYEWEKGTGLKLYEGYGQTETVSIDVGNVDKTS